jgi:hypothetical protein
MALHEHEAGDTTSSNSRYTMRTRNNLIREAPKEDMNPSRTKVNINPDVEPSEKKEDHPIIVKINII